MAEFQVFRGKAGRYRWRLVGKDGRAVSVRPGRVVATGLAGKRKQSVEAALDAALAEVAGDTHQRAKG